MATFDLKNKAKSAKPSRARKTLNLAVKVSKPKTRKDNIPFIATLQ